MDTKNMSIEDRVARIESIIEKLLKMAEAHPMGKTVLKLLGI